MNASFPGNSRSTKARSLRTYRPLEDKRSCSWLSITPIANLEIDRDAVVTGELCIAGVHFMDLKRLKDCAGRRWGKAGSRLRASFERMFLAPYQSVGPARPPIRTVAVWNARCQGTRLEDSFLDSVRNSLALLSCSLWIFKRRDPLSSFGALESAARNQRIWFFQDIERPTESAFGAMAWTRGLIPLRVDGFWIAAERTHRFMKASEAFLSDTAIASSWLKAVLCAFRLFGEGYMEHDAQQAILSNMIALDLLLFENGERKRSQLGLLSAVLDWVRAYAPPGTNWANRAAMEKLLDDRNKLVHEGYCKDLTLDELLLSDDVVGNLLHLIIRNRQTIRNKKQLREFAKRESARMTLGQRIPRRFLRRNRPVTHRWSSEQKKTIVKRLTGLQESK